ncbi:MAG: glycerate kinase type-2 family protein, partial [Anaerolineales bacterium]
MSVEIIPPQPTLLSNHPYRSIILDSLTHALDAVAGDQTVARAIQLKQGTLFIQDNVYPLHQQGKLVVVAVGKAAAAMMQGALQKLEPRVERGLVITKKIVSVALPKTEIIYGDHPVPSQHSIRAAHRLEQFIQTLTAQDTLICLISGGASALLTYPRPPLTLRQLQQTTRLLLRSGATIQEINCVRKHLEKFKGGGLAAIAQPAKIISLILSDVIDNDLASIASGLTVPDPTTFGDALHIIHQYHLEKRIPVAVLQLLQKGEAGMEPETNKAHDPLFQNVNNYLIGSNSQACQAALESFSRHGFSTLHLTSYLKGEASQVGQIFAAFARQLSENSSSSKPVCWIAGGETTVT